MKQAKFALTAVAVLAVVGGALAFKASRGLDQNGFINKTLTNGAVVCQAPAVLHDKIVTTATSGAGFTTSVFYTTTLATPCPTTRIIDNL